jgi:hypothetical protein
MGRDTSDLNLVPFTRSSLGQASPASFVRRGNVRRTSGSQQKEQILHLEESALL